MPNNYTIWPTITDVQYRLTAAGVTLRLPPGNRTDAVTQAVLAEVTRRTQRQFVPGPQGETRYYDGTGTPEQEADEMTLLSSVSVIGLDTAAGFLLDDAALTYEQGRPQTRITVARGSVTALAGMAALPYRWLFPAGRQNIAVTGQFGYAPTIPADLWDGACGEMALRLTREAIFTPAGRLNFDKAGDEEKRFALSPAEATGWHSLFEQMVRLYTRPQGRRLRNLRNRMVS